MAVAAAKPIELRISRVFAHAPADVFRALSVAEELAKWMGPPGFSVTECRMGTKPGDPWRITMRSPENTFHTVSGVLQEITPPTRLAFTWQWNGPGEEAHASLMLVTIALKAEGKGTRMDFLQTGFATENSRDMHNQGWSGSFDKLEAWRPA
ncbi:MAG: SRPBCC domain-containing protein [Alphaproteobacteria bacterium]|nr:SRPBCC domain-containing protein [Alphaproteobacteria bacterium]